MPRKLATVIAAVSLLGFAGAANVNAQVPKDPKDAPSENRNTNPGGQKQVPSNQSGTMNNPSGTANPSKNTTTGGSQNTGQADENRNTNPGGAKK